MNAGSFGLKVASEPLHLEPIRNHSITSIVRTYVLAHCLNSMVFYTNPDQYYWYGNSSWTIVHLTNIIGSGSVWGITNMLGSYFSL